MGNILGGQPQGLPLNIPVDQNDLWTIVVISIVAEVPIVILWGTSWEGSLRVCLWTITCGSERSLNNSCHFHCRWGSYNNLMGNILGGQPQGLPLNIPVDQNALWTIVVISIVGEVPIIILWGTSWEGSLRVCLWTYLWIRTLSEQ